MFGKGGLQDLTIVSALPTGWNSQKALCDQKNITGCPSGEINGRLDSGVKPWLGWLS